MSDLDILIRRGLFALNRRVEAIYILSSQFGGLLTRISQRDFAKATKTKVAPPDTST